MIIPTRSSFEGIDSLRTVRGFDPCPCGVACDDHRSIEVRRSPALGAHVK